MGLLQMVGTNVALLVAESVVYFGAMLALFRARLTLGIGTFFCALGSLHFVETYLAAAFYVTLPFDAGLSPGSVILFTGKLTLLLLVYIREDAVAARQAIYGLLFGNLLLVALVALLRLHEVVPAPGKPADLGFLDQMGVLMLWGTALLFVDCIAMILLYERLWRSLRNHPWIAVFLTLAVVLTFDQLGFFAVLHLSLGVPFSAGAGGWAGKMVAAALFSAMLVVYLSRFESGSATHRALTDVFDALTYRQRYEALEIASRHDALTRVLHRGQFESLGRDLMTVARTTHRPMSLLLVDIDHFKSVNDRFGHPMGDEVLRRIAEALSGSLRHGDYVLRYGGDEFAVFAPGVPHHAAIQLGTMLRERVEALNLPEGVDRQSLSIGVATSPIDGGTLTELLNTADKRVYAAKAAGRNRVVGAFEA